MTIKEIATMSEDFAKEVQSIFQSAKDRLVQSGCVLEGNPFDDSGDKFEYQLFWLYTDLCELDLKARHLLDEIKEPSGGNDDS